MIKGIPEDVWNKLPVEIWFKIQSYMLHVDGIEWVNNINELPLKIYFGLYVHEHLIPLKINFCLYAHEHLGDESEVSLAHGRLFVETWSLCNGIGKIRYISHLQKLIKCKLL